MRFVHRLRAGIRVRLLANGSAATVGVYRVHMATSFRLGTAIAFPLGLRTALLALGAGPTV